MADLLTPGGYIVAWTTAEQGDNTPVGEPARVPAETEARRFGDSPVQLWSEQGAARDNASSGGHKVLRLVLQVVSVIEEEEAISHEPVTERGDVFHAHRLWCECRDCLNQ